MKKNIILIIVVVIVVGVIVVLQMQKNASRVEVQKGSADIALQIGTSTILGGPALCTSSTCTTTPAISSSTLNANGKASTSDAPKLPIAAGNIASAKAAGYMTPQEKALQYPRAKELVSPDGFINTAPFKIADLIGKKVILVDFWTYSCINCQRTLPYLTDWYKKYKDAGLVIIGVETPEFDFEKIKANVEDAAKQYGITYPIVQDNNYGTWNAYENRFWPHDYLIDIDGFIVHDHIGEGSYDETEKAIQAALNEKLAREGSTQKVTTSLTQGGGAPSIFVSPETYFGSNRNEYLVNGTQALVGDQTLTANASAPDLKTSRLYLSGTWNFQPEYATNKAPASIVYKYMANKVHFVAGSDTPITVDIYNDGKFVKSVTIKESTLYTVIDQADGKQHVLEIRIPKAGLKTYTFTFS